MDGTVAEPILGKQAKVDALIDIADTLGISPEMRWPLAMAQTISACFTLPAAAWRLHAKPAVAAEAKIRIDHGDLTALLYLQGYRKSDFVTA